MFTISEIIEIAVQIEKNGESTYRRARQETSDPFLADLLGRLADEELEHQRWFTDLKSRVGTIPADKNLEAMGRELFQNILGEKAFSLDDLDLARVPDLQAVLRIAAEFEQDTVVFYEMLEPFVEMAQGRDSLRLIIEEEKRHRRDLQERLKNLI